MARTGHAVMVWLTDEMHEQTKLAAERDNRTVSGFVRHLLQLHLNRMQPGSQYSRSEASAFEHSRSYHDEMLDDMLMETYRLEE